jgi:hypothetical protein
MDLKFNELPNIGFISTKLPSEILVEIQNEIIDVYNNQIKFKPANDVLAGNMEKQFHLVKSREIIEPFLISLAWEYTKKWNYGKKIIRPIKGKGDYVNIEFELDKLWVNFQKKHEFNPNHNHMGIFSFACWMNIPYNIEDEMNLEQVKYSNAKATSCFAFSYTNILGEINNYPIAVDKNMEGSMIFFPAELNHTVYPFYTSDDYRISIAGNISFKI